MLFSIQHTHTKATILVYSILNLVENVILHVMAFVHVCKTISKE